MTEEGPILYSEAVEAACWTVGNREDKASGRVPARLGLEGQRKRRDAEQTVQGFVVQSVRNLKGMGMKVCEAAKLFLMPLRTIFDWIAKWGETPPPLQPRGRPVRAGTVAQRMAAWETLEWCGPGFGVVPLCEAHPELSRGAITEIKRDYVDWYKREYRKTIQKLEWRRPGRVWAMDFGDFPNLVAGLYAHFLPVKDLASTAMLEVFNTRDEKAQTVKKLLEFLFDFYGPPLVIKSDNGSGFIESKLRTYIESRGVKLLLSPPRLPSYNGGAESGVGSVKNHAFDHALATGDPCEWTLDDIYAAKLRCNETRRSDGRVPRELLENHAPVTEEEREAFHVCYRKHEETGRRRFGFTEGGKPPTREEKNQIDRYALREALVECGYLSFKRRRITPSIRKRNRARI